MLNYEIQGKTGSTKDFTVQYEEIRCTFFVVFFSNVLYNF